MTIIYVPREIGSQIPSIETHVRSNLLNKVVYYVIDSKYRKAVNLTISLKNEMRALQYDKEIVDIAKSLKGKNHDETALNCLKWVKDHVNYVTDQKKWGMNEKWESARNVYETEEGDCESGARLLYVLARLAGIPASKLWIQCGSVKGGGHAWIGYIPDEYPLNFVYLDWCYCYKPYSIPIRNKFTVADKAIHEYKRDGEKVKSNYYNLWFVFNEEASYREFR